MKELTCKSCDFYIAVIEWQRKLDPHSYLIGISDRIGYCRRFPPDNTEKIRDKYTAPLQITSREAGELADETLPIVPDYYFCGEHSFWHIVRTAEKLACREAEEKLLRMIREE